MSALDSTLAWFLGLSLLALIAAMVALVALALLAAWLRMRADQRHLASVLREDRR